VLQEFSVTCRKDKWFVDERPEAHGPCLNRHDALTDAIDAAKNYDVAKGKTECAL
jgi:hypothetical protein